MVMNTRKIPRLEEILFDQNISERFKERNTSRYDPPYSNRRKKDSSSQLHERRLINQNDKEHSDENDFSDDDRMKEKSEIHKLAERVCGDWSEHVSRSGKRYFYNSRTETSQWEKPKNWIDSLPMPVHEKSQQSNKNHVIDKSKQSSADKSSSSSIRNNSSNIKSLLGEIKLTSNIEARYHCDNSDKIHSLSDMPANKLHSSDSKEKIRSSDYADYKRFSEISTNNKYRLSYSSSVSNKRQMSDNRLYSRIEKQFDVDNYRIIDRADDWRGEMSNRTRLDRKSCRQETHFAGKRNMISEQNKNSVNRRTNDNRSKRSRDKDDIRLDRYTQKSKRLSPNNTKNEINTRESKILSDSHIDDECIIGITSTDESEHINNEVVTTKENIVVDEGLKRDVIIVGEDENGVNVPNGCIVANNKNNDDCSPQLLDKNQNRSVYEDMDISPTHMSPHRDPRKQQTPNLLSPNKIQSNPSLHLDSANFLSCLQHSVSELSCGGSIEVGNEKISAGQLAFLPVLLTQLSVIQQSGCQPNNQHIIQQAIPLLVRLQEMLVAEQQHRQMQQRQLQQLQLQQLLLQLLKMQKNNKLNSSTAETQAESPYSPPDSDDTPTTSSTTPNHHHHTFAISNCVTTVTSNQVATPSHTIPAMSSLIVDTTTPTTKMAGVHVVSSSTKRLSRRRQLNQQQSTPHESTSSSSTPISAQPSPNPTTPLANFTSPPPPPPEGLAGLPLVENGMELSTSLSKYVNQELTTHIHQNHPIDEAHVQAERLHVDNHALTGVIICQFLIDLKRDRSLIRSQEILSTLNEQRIISIRQQIIEVEKAQPPIPISYPGPLDF